MAQVADCRKDGYSEPAKLGVPFRKDFSLLGFICRFPYFVKLPHLVQWHCEVRFRVEGLGFGLDGHMRHTYLYIYIYVCIDIRRTKLMELA